MKFLYVLIVSIMCFLPQKSYALSCLAKDFTAEAFENIDFIAKGKVSDFWLDKINPFSMEKITFYLNVEKAWKGTKSGEKVKIIYQKSGGDGFPYTQGGSYIIYAFKNKKNILVTDGCAALFDFPMSPELTAFSIERPYYLAEKTTKELKYINEMMQRLKNLEEDTLDKYSK